MPLKFNLRVPIFQNFPGEACPQTPSISMQYDLTAPLLLNAPGPKFLLVPLATKGENTAILVSICNDVCMHM